MDSWPIGSAVENITLTLVIIVEEPCPDRSAANHGRLNLTSTQKGANGV
jgi:hypothetical protein